MKKKRTVKENEYLESSGAQESIEEFKALSADIHKRADVVARLLSNLNIEAFQNHIDVKKCEVEFDRPWQKLDRPQAYEWMSDAYRAVEALGFYAIEVAILSNTLCELHRLAQDTVELTEKAFADAKITIGMEVA